MEKILLVLAFAVLAAADVNEFSEEVTAAVTSTEVPNMGLCNLTGLAKQVKLLKELGHILIKAQNCKIPSE